MHENPNYIPFGDKIIDEEMQERGWMPIQEESSRERTCQYAQANGFCTQELEPQYQGEAEFYSTLVFDPRRAEIMIIEWGTRIKHDLNQIRADGWVRMDSDRFKGLYVRTKRQE